MRPANDAEQGCGDPIELVPGLVIHCQRPVGHGKTHCSWEKNSVTSWRKNGKSPRRTIKRKQQ